MSEQVGNGWARSLILTLKGMTEEQLREAQRAGEFLDYAAQHGLAVEAMASFIAGLREGESVDEAVFRARCDWDI